MKILSGDRKKDVHISITSSTNIQELKRLYIMEITYQVMFAYIFGSASTIIDQKKIKYLKSSSERRKNTSQYELISI